MATIADRIWLPDHVRSEYASHDEPLAEMRDIPEAGYLARYLKENLDPRLKVIWVRRGAKNFDHTGVWAIVRENEKTKPTVWLICHEDGTYRTPGAEDIQRLQEADTWAHPGIWRRHRRRQEELQRQKEKRSEAKHEEFREKLEERLGFVFDTSIALPGELEHTAIARGRKRRARKQQRDARKKNRRGLRQGRGR